MSITAYNRTGGVQEINSQISDLQGSMKTIKKETAETVNKVRKETAETLENISKKIKKE